VLLPPPLPPRLFSPPFCHFPCFFNAFFETFFPEELEDEDEEEEESGGETALAAVGFAHNFFLLFDALFLKKTVFGETHIVRKDEKEEVIFVLMRSLGRVEKERMLLEV
jgi:hypothetical protein